MDSAPLRMARRLLACAAAAVVLPAQACDTRDACVSAIMSATRAGEAVTALQMTRQAVRLNRGAAPPVARDVNRVRAATVPYGNVNDTLAALLEGVQLGTAWSPDFLRLLALSYLSGNRPHDAERQLRDALGRFPAHAPLWGDLATALAMQGKTDDAVSALTVAYAYAADQPLALKNYAQGEAISALPAMRPVYQAALAAIAVQNAAAAAALPPIPAQTPTPGNGHTAATADFSRCEKPEWPRQSLRNEETGEVTLAFYVDENGKPLAVRKLGSSGHVALDLAAMAGVASCGFTPAQADGKPVASWMKIKYVWTLK